MKYLVYKCKGMIISRKFQLYGIIILLFVKVDVFVIWLPFMF